MTRLRIRHESIYTYSRPVRFGTWRLLMRPLDTHAIRLIDASLEAPPSDVTWSYDAYGNSICHLTPFQASDRLTIINNLVVERYPLSIASPVQPVPTGYQASDQVALAPFLAPADDEASPTYLAWLDNQSMWPDEPAFLFLQRLNQTIHDTFQYRARFEPGTQSASQTVERASGTCRDFAWLMIESVRRLGFAARFATGYLHSPGQFIRGSGATHAWCEVFLPGQGWMEFDPTNGLVESASLIRVATTRTWQECNPVHGEIFDTADCEEKVAVDVDLITEDCPVALSA